VRPVVDTSTGLDDCLASLTAGTGPLAVDTERAQTFRYSAKAYLIQLRREGAGTWLIDPVAFERDDDRADLSVLVDAIGETDWILHAASQDLPCLAEDKLVPPRVFDTELAGRLLGLPRVGLGALVETALGVRLLKEYSAVDWSTRPLPPEWLVYAALDVELLADLRSWMQERLVEAGKDEWARQEFEHVLTTFTAPPTPRDQPWRRTSGIHHVRGERALGVVEQLWTIRDKLARQQDRAPGRLLPDRVIVEIAGLVDNSTRSLSKATILGLPGMKRRQYARNGALWTDAVNRALTMKREELPSRNAPHNGPPPPRSWEGKKPEAYRRWTSARPAVIARAEELQLPVENLVSPETLRNLLWGDPPPDWQEALRTAGARPWQVEHVAPVLSEAIEGDR
jgi:ribonuclease D